MQDANKTEMVEIIAPMIAAQIETSVHVLAILALCTQKGLFTGEEFAAAIPVCKKEAASRFHQDAADIDCLISRLREVAR